MLASLPALVLAVGRDPTRVDDVNQAPSPQPPADSREIGSSAKSSTSSRKRMDPEPMPPRPKATPHVHISEPQVRVTEWRFVSPGAETGWASA